MKNKTQATQSTEMMTGTDPLTASLRESRKRRACLLVLYGQDVGRRHILTQEVTVTGRDAETDFQIHDSKLSRKHFAILHKKPKYYLKDLSSRNGTLLNDAKVTRETELKFGDKIQCGEAVLQFVSEASMEHLLVDKLREESYRDGLTQVYNKKILPELEKELFGRIQKEKSTLAVIMFDIDHFKKLNDTYGHLFGDEVLGELAKWVKTKLTRTEDVMIRFGGEEFLVVVPHTTRKTAMSVGERIRKASALMMFRCKNQNVQLTVSVGVRFWDARKEGDVSGLTTLIEEADQALYASKGAGRNRVTLYAAS